MSAVDRHALARWLERQGFVRDVRNGEGGHAGYVRETDRGRQRLSIPQHGPNSMNPKTLGSIVRKLKAYGYAKESIFQGVKEA